MRYTVVRAVVIGVARSDPGGRSVIDVQAQPPATPVRRPLRRAWPRLPHRCSGPLARAVHRAWGALRVIVPELGEAVCEEFTDSPCLAVLVPLASRVMGRLRSVRRRLATKRCRHKSQGPTAEVVEDAPQPPALPADILLVALHIVGRDGEGANSSGEAG